MPKRSLMATHEILLKMAMQDFSASDPDKPYIWQVRHGGMLGLKYEVAIRRDMFIQESDTSKEEPGISLDMNTQPSDEGLKQNDILKSVVSSAILG